MASEYFTGGSLLPTDWGWHEGMEEWKPLYEVLDLPVPDQPVFNPAMAPQRGGGKGKKIAKIAGLAVLAIGRIAAGILYGPKLLGLLLSQKVQESFLQALLLLTSLPQALFFGEHEHPWIWQALLLLILQIFYQFDHHIFPLLHQTLILQSRDQILLLVPLP